LSAKESGGSFDVSVSSSLGKRGITNNVQSKEFFLNGSIDLNVFKRYLVAGGNYQGRENFLILRENLEVQVKGIHGYLHIDNIHVVSVESGYELVSFLELVD